MIRQTALVAVVALFCGDAARAATQPSTIATPGSGDVADPAGNRWSISASGSIRENGQWVAGGGETAELVIAGDVVYGLDDTGRGWFIFGSKDRVWIPSAAPASGSSGAATVRSNGVSAAPMANLPVTPPAAAPSCAGSALGSGSFGVLPTVEGGVGQIFDPSGRPFVPRGIGVEYPNQPSPTELRALFPGINFVRLAIYQYDSPQSLAGYVNSLTAAGIVVEIENHNNGAGNAGGSQGPMFSGQDLSNESNWYSSIAAAFKSNPLVWFGTNNEPSETTASGNTDPGALSNWQMSTYQSIRSTGNSSPILIELNGYADPASFGQGYNPAVYAQMNNVIWDMHYYGWLTKYSTDQAKNDSFIAAAIKQSQSIPSAGGVLMPVIIGEYGDSTTGATIDPNWEQVIAAVHGAVGAGTAAGSAAWAYTPGDPGDGLLSYGGGALSAYGRQVATYVSSAIAAASASAASCASTSSASANQGAASVVAINAPDSAPANDPAAATPGTSQATAAAAQADTQAATADAQIAAIQAQAAALTAGSQTPSLKAVGDTNGQ